MSDTSYTVGIDMHVTFQSYIDSLHPPKITIEFLNYGKPMESPEKDRAFDQLVGANVTINGKAEYAPKVEHETLHVNPKPTNPSGGSEQMFSGRDDGKTFAI